MLGSRVRFGFAAGEGSPFRVSLRSPAPAAGTGGSLAALVSQEPPGLWSPLCQLLLHIFWGFIFFFFEVTPQWESALCFWLLLS